MLPPETAARKGPSLARDTAAAVSLARPPYSIWNVPCVKQLPGAIFIGGALW